MGDADNVPGLAAESLIIKIGENVARLSVYTTNSYPEVPWSLIKRMRDRLAHHYEGTDGTPLSPTSANDPESHPLDYLVPGQSNLMGPKPGSILPKIFVVLLSDSECYHRVRFDLKFPAI
ncbi:DUF86 domain-containing protein [Paenarthrobacter sp. NyZ202]|uniref:HepT-like ribonuclease domain-containing protein n=1 Tax=Paenarthrobacter sp. NyZ202 TaxID=3402689 RepID=UPI003CE67253